MSEPAVDKIQRLRDLSDERAERMGDLHRRAQAAEASLTQMREALEDAALFVQAVLESPRVTLGAPLRFAAKGNLETLRATLSNLEKQGLRSSVADIAPTLQAGRASDAEGH